MSNQTANASVKTTNAIETAVVASSSADAADRPQGAKTAELLRELDRFLERFGDINRYKPLRDYGHLLAQAVQEIRTARKEWDARVFLVVVCGPVKAGKSTLVNLLAGRSVSPVAREECTRRPSLILQARQGEQEQIEMFFSEEAAAEPEEKRRLDMRNFDRIMQYLRGVISQNELRRSCAVSTQAEPITSENIQRILAGDMGREPLLVVLKVRPQRGKKTIINEHLALVDMPGLDGAHAGTEAAPFHEWVFAHADFLLFVQSSVAALTGQVSKFMERHWGKQHRKLPVWMIHNIIDGKHWRPEDQRRSQEMKNMRNAVYDIAHRLGVTNFPAFSLNLAMAWDAAIEDPKHYYEKYYRKSDFGTFLKSFYSYISEHYKTLHEKNWVGDRVPGRLQRVKQAAEELKKKLEEAQDRRKDAENRLRRARKALEKIAPMEDGWSRELSELLAVRVKVVPENSETAREVVKNVFAHWKDVAHQRINCFLPPAMITGEDLKGRVERYLDEVAKEGAFLMRNENKLNKVRDSIQEYHDKREEEVRRQLQEIFGEDFNVPEPPPFSNTSYGRLEWLDAPFKKPQNVKIKEYVRHWKKMFLAKSPKEYTKDEVAPILDKVRGGIENEMRKRVEAWREQIEHAVHKYSDERQRTLVQAVNRYEEELREQFKEEDTVLGKVKADLREMEKAIQDIETARRFAEHWLPFGHDNLPATPSGGNGNGQQKA